MGVIRGGIIMKKILFAMAALAALASCQKAEIAEQNSVNTNGERVITAYFDNAQTKTSLDNNGVTPKWTVGDKIMVLDGSGHQEITLGVDGIISSDGKSVTFTVTDLSGTLYAVYPSDATDADRIVTENIVPVTLKAEQDGTFGSANICVAKENDGSLAFKNVTSVLHLTQEDDTNVNEIIITTGSVTAYIAGTGTVDMSTDGQPALTLSSNQSNKIKVKSESVNTHYYIAVAPTTLPAGTAFGFATGSKLGGTNLSEEKTIAANTIYNIGSMDADAIDPHTYHDYVEIEMTVNSVTKKYKWATMNIGASSATDAGTYFAWGDVEGQTWSDSDWSGGGFSDAPDIGNPSVLPLDKDAANVNWGGTWRMPTSAEFYELKSKHREHYYDEDYFGDPESGLICLPAAGYGDDTGLHDVDGSSPGGYYWSSSLGTYFDYYACYLYFVGGSPGIEDNYRSRGQSVRALSE